MLGRKDSEENRMLVLCWDIETDVQEHGLFPLHVSASAICRKELFTNADDTTAVNEQHLEIGHGESSAADATQHTMQGGGLASLWISFPD